MKYMLLIYDNEKVWSEAMPPDEQGRLFGEYMAFTERHQGVGPLHLGRTAAAGRDGDQRRIRNDKQLVTDGPFAETQEQLGGYYLVEARDLNEAIGIAARIPSVRLGTIEVRPVMDVGAPA